MNRRPKSGHRHPKTAARLINLRRRSPNSLILRFNFLAGISHIPRKTDLLLLRRRNQAENQAAVEAVRLKILAAQRPLLRDHQPPVARAVPPHHPRHVRRLIVRTRQQSDRRRVLHRLAPPGAVGAAAPAAAGGDRSYIGCEIGAALDAEVVTEFLILHGDFISEGNGEQKENF